MTETNWNQSSKGLLDEFSAIIEELAQYHHVATVIMAKLII